MSEKEQEDMRAEGNEKETAQTEDQAAEDNAEKRSADFDFENADEATPYKFDMSDEEIEKGSAVRFTIILIAALAVAVFFVWYAIHLTKTQNIVPELGTVKYEDLVEDYDLPGDADDQVEEAYLSKAEVRFGEAKKLPGASPFGADKKYEFTGQIYAPDLDSVYSQNADAAGAEKAIKGLSESDLKAGDKVKVETDNKGRIKDDDAEALQMAVENSYKPLEDEVQQTGN
ncbi:MAG: hypothetical protein SOV71_04705 [Anaerovoracaceae bacterium]|nr:hypothetical protein [Bacillota bacterium]MDY2670837.1 hypothetical protein [Anaerovoracaceae bacterium]